MSELREHINLFESEDELADIPFLLFLNQSITEWDQSITQLPFGYGGIARRFIFMMDNFMQDNPGDNELRRLFKEKKRIYYIIIRLDTGSSDDIIKEIKKLNDPITDKLEKLLQDIGWYEVISKWGYKPIKVALLSFQKIYGMNADPLKYMSIIDLMTWAEIL